MMTRSLHYFLSTVEIAEEDAALAEKLATKATGAIAKTALEPILKADSMVEETKNI